MFPVISHRLFMIASKDQYSSRYMTQYLNHVDWGEGNFPAEFDYVTLHRKRIARLMHCVGVLNAPYSGRRVPLKPQVSQAQSQPQLKNSKRGARESTRPSRQPQLDKLLSSYPAPQPVGVLSNSGCSQNRNPTSHQQLYP